MRAAPSPHRARGTVQRRKSHKFAAIAAGLFLATGVTWGGLNSDMGKLISAFGNIMLLTCLLVAAPADDRFWQQARLLLAFVVLAVVWLVIIHFGIAVVPFARDPLSLAPDLFGIELAAIAGSVAILLCGMRIGANSDDGNFAVTWFIVPTAIIFGITFALRSLGQTDQISIWTLSWQGRFAGPLGNANVTAAVAGCMAMIILGQILKDACGGLTSDTERQGQGRLRYFVHFALLAVSLVSLTATASRFALIMTVALVVLLIWRATRLGLPKATTRYLAVGAAIAAFAFAALAPQTLLADRFSEIDSEGGARLFMWSHYLELVLASPIYGYGIGSFSVVNQQNLTSLELANALWRVNSPHNILLQMALGGGLLYLGAMLVAAGHIVTAIARDLSLRHWPIDRLGCASGIALIGACSCVDIALDVPAVVALALFLCGLLWRPAKIAAVPAQAS